MTALPEREAIVALIDEAVGSGARRARACWHAGIDARTCRRWRDGVEGVVRPDARPEAVRPLPSNRLSEEEREAILLTCHKPRFADLPPSQIVPTLADEGVYLGSESSFYRVLHANAEQVERGRARRRSSPVITTHEATGPNQVWTWDVTYLNTPVRGLYYYLYMVIDIYSRKVVGWEVHEAETGELAAELITRTVLAEACRDRGVVLHADNGAPQRSSTLRSTLDALGLRSSFSRPRVSNDNAYSEAAFRTTKYRRDFPVEGFADLGAAREWVLGFVSWYNGEHCHSSIKFVSPKERHEGRDVEILAGRKRVYEEAKRKNPSRWSGATRNWEAPTVVWLNPERSPGGKPEISEKAA